MRFIRGSLGARLSNWPRVSTMPAFVPPAKRPVVRLLGMIVAILVIDRITSTLIQQGWTMSLGVVTGLRIVTALSILRFPIAGFLLALEVDKWDWYWLSAGDRDGEFQALYQSWDKVLDLFVMTVAAVVVLGWYDRTMRAITLVTLAWRAVGVAIFLATENRWTLLAFPNVFETLFMMYVIYYLVSGHPHMLRSTPIAVLAVVVALIPKLAEEYFLHAIETRPWDLIALPLPDAIEPPLWVALKYLPAVALVIYLAITSRELSVRGDRETQLSIA